MADLPLTSSWADADPDAEALPDILMDNIPKLEIREEDMIKQTVYEEPPLPVNPPRPPQQPKASNSWLRRGPPDHHSNNNGNNRRGFVGGNQQNNQRAPPRPPQNGSPFQLQLENISFGAQERDLLEFLAPCQPTNIYMLRERGKFKGSVSVQFANDQGFKQASSLNGVEFMGRPIRVSTGRGGNSRGSFNNNRNNSFRSQQQQQQRDPTNTEGEASTSSRPRLKLKPRTVTRPVGESDETTRSSDIFGAAKPREEPTPVAKAPDSGKTEETDVTPDETVQVDNVVDDTVDEAPTENTEEVESDGFISVTARGANKGKSVSGNSNKASRGGRVKNNKNNNGGGRNNNNKQWQKKTKDSKKAQAKPATTKANAPSAKPAAVAPKAKVTEEAPSKAKKPINPFALLDGDDSD